MSGLEAVRFGSGGLVLAGDAAGPADGPRVVFLPGSGQTRQSWGRALEEAARRGFRGIAMDLRGHGDSDWSPDGRYLVEDFAEDARAVAAQAGPPVALVGASLGGMASMMVAAEAPALVSALVLVDITPRIEKEGAHEVLAFMESGAEGFASLEAAAEAVAAYLPHRARPKDTSGLQRNLRLRDGRWHWHYDPAFIRTGRAMADGPEAEKRAGEALADRARALAMPTLLVRGGKSRIVTAEAAREFQALVPHADYVDIAEADHMVAGDANDRFNGAVFAFLERHLGGR